MCLLSIIVPIYNVELYLETCLRSLTRQTLQDIEILLINDGSTDRSGEIAQSYASQDTRIKLFHQQNSGQGIARNVGLEMAKGKYVAFVDSDDWVILSAFKRLVDVAEEYEADMVMGNVLFCYNNGKRIDRYKRTNKSVFENGLPGNECLIHLSKQYALSPMVVTYLYIRELLEKHHLRFEPTIHEDELWVPQTFCFAQKVKVIDFLFYGYRQREGSTMYSKNYLKRYEALMHIAEQLIKFTSPIASDPRQLELASWLYVRIIGLYHFVSLQLRFLPENYFSFFLSRLKQMEDDRPVLFPESLVRYQQYRNLIKLQLS